MPQLPHLWSYQKMSENKIPLKLTFFGPKSIVRATAFYSILMVHTLYLEQFYSCTYKFSLFTSLCTHVLDCAPCNIRTATGYSGAHTVHGTVLQLYNKSSLCTSLCTHVLVRTATVQVWCPPTYGDQWEHEKDNLHELCRPIRALEISKDTTRHTADWLLGRTYTLYRVRQKGLDL